LSSAISLAWLYSSRLSCGSRTSTKWLGHSSQSRTRLRAGSEALLCNVNFTKFRQHFSKQSLALQLRNLEHIRLRALCRPLTVLTLVCLQKCPPYVGSEVLTALSMKNTVIFDVSPCCLVEAYWCFRETSCLHHQVQRVNQASRQLCLFFDPEDGGSTFIQHPGILLLDYMVSHPKR
jgi:hypothetical protein